MTTTPPLPRSFSKPDLEACGFAGWQTWDELQASGFSAIPSGPAAYVVYRSSTAGPTFLDANAGGRFKGKDPTVAPERLRTSWVSGCQVVYIGKADVANRRLKQFARFGAGEPVGHWGGRYIWQLADVRELLVAWHAISWDEVAREYERRLMARYAALHSGARPFANLTG